MAKQTLDDLPDLRGKKVLVRVDFNVPLDPAGNITNDRRIRAPLPTLRKLLERGAAVVVMSHLGRPKGDPRKDVPFRMDRAAARLGELLGRPVRKVDEVVGPAARAAVQALQGGEVLVLENLRFHPGEQAGDAGFAGQLAALGDAYVNDAFGTCHRKDASMVAVPAAMRGKPRVVGTLVARELEILDRLLSNPARPLLGILGGGKVSDKMGFIKVLLARVDRVLIGGAMSYTFMKAQGQEVGDSRLEADKLDLARELLTLGKGKITLPVDHLVVDKVDAPQTARVVEGAIPAGTVGVDIGPKTIALYCEAIGEAATVVWNGPLGKFEDEAYSRGTREVARALAASKAVSIVGGGETAEAVEELGLAEKMTHVSTGGGAFLEYVEGTPFAALAEIDERHLIPEEAAMSYALLALVWVVNLGISIWNAYAVGKAWVETKHAGGWPRFMAWMGAIMSASGFTWCYLLLLALIAYWVDWLQRDQIAAMLNLGYILIIPGVLFSGFMIMIDSWAQAYRRRTLGSFGTAAYNTFAQIYNTYHAIQGLGQAFRGVADFFGGGSGRSRDSRDNSGGVVLVILLVLLALFGGILTTAAIIRRVAASDGPIPTDRPPLQRA